MNRRVLILAVVLATAAFFTVHGAFSQSDSQSKRRVINLPDRSPQAPFKTLLTQAGFTMDDLVYVQISCTDLAYYDKFNALYKTYFTKDFPAREFIGVASVLRGGHFEMQAIAARH